jgi:hypothetical protein
MEELEELSKPIIEWLLKNYDPMCKVVIEQGKVEVLRTEICNPTLEVRD